MTEDRLKAAPGGRHSAKHGAPAAKPRAATGAKSGAAAGAKKSAAAGAKRSAATGAKKSAKSGSKSGTKSRAKSGASFGEKFKAKLSAATGAVSNAVDRVKSGAQRGEPAAKKRRKGKKKGILHSTFYRVYFAVVLLCAIGIIVGANWLRGLLADYETAQPSHVADAAAQMFEDADYDTVYSYDTNAAQIAGDKQYYIDSMREIAQGKDVTWSESYSSSEDEKVYNVLLSGEKFAEMKLVPSGETTGHGNRLWKLDSVTTNVTMGEQEEPEPEEEPVVEEEPAEPEGVACTITVPSEFAVTVDGQALTEEAVVNAAIPVVPEGLLPEGVPNPTMTEYRFYSVNGSPQIAVADASGNAQQVTSSGENSWTCALPEAPELKEQFEKPVVEIAKQIARCAAKTTTKEAVLKYCVKNSPARESINKFDNSTGYNKKPEKFENVQSSNYYRYADNCFSCHVSFDYLSRFNSKVTKTYPTTITLYFVLDGNSGKLYSFTLY